MQKIKIDNMLALPLNRANAGTKLAVQSKREEHSNATP
jgi:hypothetical protein